MSVLQLQESNIQAYVPEYDLHGRYIWEAVREGLWPFKPRTINLYVENDIDYQRYVLFVEIWFPDGQYRRRADMDISRMLDDIDKEVSRVADEIFRSLRFRNDLDLPTNIVLGEN